MTKNYTWMNLGPALPHQSLLNQPSHEISTHMLKCQNLHYKEFRLIHVMLNNTHLEGYVKIHVCMQFHLLMENNTAADILKLN